MKRIFKKKIMMGILIVILVDVVIGCFLFTNRSFPRLAMWNIIESDKLYDFYWHPKDAPEYFHFETNSDKLSIFRDEILPLVKAESDDLEKAIKVARYVGDIGVLRFTLYTSGLQWDSPEGILKQIRAGRGGNCFHYSILYSTYLASVGIKSRLWTLEGDDGLQWLSHTITEVYIRTLKKWVLIDAMREIYFTKENQPLSVLELRDGLLGGEAEEILVHSVSKRTEEPKIVFENYTRLLKCVFLRASNDFVDKYDAKIRFGAFSKFQVYLDRLPSDWRRGLDYLFGRRDFLIHYVDRFSRSLRPKLIIARGLFYFFAVSSALIFTFLLIILPIKVLRRFFLAINLSRKDTCQK